MKLWVLTVERLDVADFSHSKCTCQPYARAGHALPATRTYSQIAHLGNDLCTHLLFCASYGHAFQLQLT